MLSVTDLSGYLFCKRKLFLEKVLGIRSPIPKKALVMGNLRHTVAEKIVKNDERIITSIKKEDKIDKFEDVFDKFKREYSKILTEQIVRNKNRLRELEITLQEAFDRFWKTVLRDANNRAEIVWKFIENKKVYGIELWENIVPKLKAEYRLESEILGLRGIIDRIDVYPEFLVPIELKTGKAPSEGVWEGHKIQIGSYLLLLQEIYGDSIKKGVVHYVESSRIEEISLNPFLRDEIIGIVKEVKELLVCGRIPSKELNIKKCNACSLCEQCSNEKLIKSITKERKINYQ